MAELSFGGEPLRYDQGGQIQGFLDKYQDLIDLRDIAPTLKQRFDGFPLPNYPTPPQIRLNQLYWPTGAARWTAGYFLADNKAKEAIVAAAHPTSSTNTPLAFKASDDLDSEDFETSLYLLAARRIPSVPGGRHLWLMVLVDERYWWQFRSIEDTQVTASTTWDALYSTLGSQLGVTIDVDEVAVAYLKPDPVSLTKRYDNAAILLDAVAHSVGQRICRRQDGTVQASSWSTSQALRLANMVALTPVRQAAGGDIGYGPVPASVDVVCRKFVDGIPIPDKAQAYNEVAADHLADTPETTTSTAKTFHSTAYADCTTSGTDSAPSNNADLATLAGEIASDYYDSTLFVYDRTFDAIKEWKPSGYDDHILYQFGGEYPNPTITASTIITNQDEERPAAKTKLAKGYTRRYHTRVQSCMPNFGAEHQLSQDALTVLGPFQFGVLDEELNGNNPATMSVHVSSDIGDRTVTGHEAATPNIEVYNFLGKDIPSGTSVYAWFNFESERWYVNLPSGKAKWIRFSLDGALLTTDASQASCQVEDFWQGSTPGATVTVWNMTASANYVFEGDAGDMGLATLDDIDDKYRIVQMECP